MLAVTTVQEIAMIEIGIAFGTERDVHYVSFHEISASLSPRTSLAVLLVFMPLQDVTQYHTLLNQVRKLHGKHHDVTVAFYELHRATEDITVQSWNIYTTSM